MDIELAFGPIDPVLLGTLVIAYSGVKLIHPTVNRGFQGIEGLHPWRRVAPWVGLYHQYELARLRLGIEHQDNWQRHIAESRCEVRRWVKEQTDRDRLCGRGSKTFFGVVS